MVLDFLHGDSLLRLDDQHSPDQILGVFREGRWHEIKARFDLLQELPDVLVIERKVAGE